MCTTMALPLIVLFAATSMVQVVASFERHSYVTQALAENRPLYYFGLGSNMLQSKLENRSVDGTPIEHLSFEPAYVKGHRLAFNMLGFVPLEPAMASLEQVHDDDDLLVGTTITGRRCNTTVTRPLYSYHKPECHGALVQLTPENYEKVMQSEGIRNQNSASSTASNGTTASTSSSNDDAETMPGKRNRQKQKKRQPQPPPGYEEVVVTAYPYDTSKAPVQAVALKLRQGSKIQLKRDLAPSQRYMNILREGAKQLQLRDDYQQFLHQHPVQNTPIWLRNLAMGHLVYSMSLSHHIKQLQVVSRLYNKLLFLFYVPPQPSSTTTQSLTSNTAQQPGSRIDRNIKPFTSNLLIGMFLFPGFVMGTLFKQYYKLVPQHEPPFVKRFTSFFGETKTRQVEDKSQSTELSTTKTIAATSAEKQLTQTPHRTSQSTQNEEPNHNNPDEAPDTTANGISASGIKISGHKKEKVLTS